MRKMLFYLPSWILIAALVPVIIFGFYSFKDGRSYTKVISSSATLDFPNTAAGTTSDLTITLNGAINTDPVILGVDNASIVANTQYTAWVSASNTVTVRFGNLELLAAHNPASGTFKVTIIKN